MSDTPIYAPGVAESIVRLQQAKDQSSGGTPTAVREAFVPVVLNAGGLELPPVNMGKILILESLQSPYLVSLERPSSLRDILIALYVLSQPENQVTRELIARGEFDAALDQWTDSLPPGVLRGAGEIVSAHLDKGFATTIPYGRDNGKVPLTVHPSPATDSGGSSPSPTH